ARQFALCDNYFTDVAGPSTPNHLMLISADSPVIVNPPWHRLPVGQPLFKLPTLRERLDRKKLTWANYGGDGFGWLQGPRRPSRVGRHPVPLRLTGRLPGARTVRQVQVHFERAAFPRQSVEVLRKHIRPGGPE